MNEYKNIVKKGIVQVLFPILVGASTFLLTKSKYDTEVVENEILNVKSAIDIYKAMADDIYDKYSILKDRQLLLEEKIKELEKNCP